MDERTAAVRRMQEYISEHYTGEISLSSLAKAAMFSPWYARRLFIERLGISPMDYIRRLRLSRSALMLRDERCTVTDAAMEVGFASVDGYQRAFLKEFGCNPGEYAKNPVPICLFKPYKITETGKGERNMENLRNVFISIAEKPERKVILKRGVNGTEYWSYSNEVGCDVWGLLTSIRSLEGEPVCMWLPEKYRDPVTNSYVQGVEVALDYAGEIPEGFEIITLPAATFLKFQGEPFEEEDFEQAIGEMWEAEKRFKPESIGYRWDDENPKIQLEPVGSRGYIEYLPVKK